MVAKWLLAVIVAAVMLSEPSITAQPGPAQSTKMNSKSTAKHTSTTAQQRPTYHTSASSKDNLPRIDPRPYGRIG